MLSRRYLIALLFLVIGGPLPAQGPGKGLVIVLLGPPGSGKTTQANFLKREYRIPFLSAAEVLRRSHDRKSRISEPAKAERAGGDLLSDDALNDLMREYIRRVDFTKGFILDGYPASREQAEYLAKMASEMKLDPPVTIVLEVPDQVARQRLERRRRADDTPAQIERRIADYHREWEAIRAVYPESRIMRVDGTKPAGEVSREIKALLDGVR